MNIIIPNKRRFRFILESWSAMGLGWLEASEEPHQSGGTDNELRWQKTEGKFSTHQFYQFWWTFGFFTLCFCSQKEYHIFFSIYYAFSYETWLYHFTMHWSVWGTLHPGQEKLVNCNQILDHVAEQNCRAKFHMSLWNFIDVVVSRNTQYKDVTTNTLCFCTERCWHLN